MKIQNPCNFCGKTDREQMKGCNEISCYRQYFDKIVTGKLTEGNNLSWIDMHYLDGNIIQIKLDLSNFDPGMVINTANATFILTPERFLKEIKNEN